MEKLTQFFNMIDKGEEHIGNNKKFYMFIATTFITIYTLIMTKPPSYNFEIILELAIVMIPIIAMMSALFDVISIKGRELCIKLITRLAFYISIYFILNCIQTIFFQ